MFPNLLAEVARKGWTMKTFASRLGMATTNLSMKMRGKNGFTLEEAKSIKKVLGVTMPLDDLFMWDERGAEG